MQPSSATYWHIGETTMRFGNVMPPSWIGVKSLGSANLDLPFGERAPQRLGERRGARLVAVDAQRVGCDGYALAGERGHVSVLDHRQRLRHRLICILDHAAGLLARRA